MCLRTTAALFFSFLSLPAGADNPGAVVVYVQGTVRIQRAGGVESLAALGSEIAESDTVVTDDASQVRVRLFDRSLLRIGPNSRAQMTELRVDAAAEHKDVSVKLFVGKLWASVSKLLTADSKFEVEAANAVAGVRGTKLTADSDGTHGSFGCLEGSVNVKAGDQHQLIEAGTAVGFLPGGLGETTHLSLQQIIQLNQEARGGTRHAPQLGNHGAEQKAGSLATTLGERLAQLRDRNENQRIRDRFADEFRNHSADAKNRGGAYQEFNEAARLGIPLDRTRIVGTVTVH